MRGSVDNIAVTIYNPNDEIDSIAEVTSRLSVTGQHAPAGAAAAAAAAAVAAADAGTLRPPPENVQPGDTTLTVDFGGFPVMLAFCPSAEVQAQALLYQCSLLLGPYN
jgi:hypothetical protein